MEDVLKRLTSSIISSSRWSSTPPDLQQTHRDRLQRKHSTETATALRIKQGHNCATRTATNLIYTLSCRLHGILMSSDARAGIFWKSRDVLMQLHTTTAAHSSTSICCAIRPRNVFNCMIQRVNRLISQEGG